MKEGSFDKEIPHLPHLQRRLKTPITTNVNGYYYYVSPIESTPDAIDPLLLHEIAQEIINLGLTNDVDLIFCLEAMGIAIACTIAQMTGIKMCIARKKDLKLKVSLEFDSSTHYSNRKFYVYCPIVGRRVLIVDDVIASGNTMRSAIKALIAGGAQISSCVCLVAKGDSVKHLKSELGIDVVALAHI
jgi:adenine/guanine phosphoribosyltransferase-like PRPP-binding protein